MYLSYYNFTCKPFELIPNPEFIYLSRTHKKAMTYLEYGIRDRAGFVLLTGEVGSGKTTIIRELIDKHLKKGVLAKVFNTNANSEQLLAMINDDFDLSIHGKDKIALLRDLNHFLVEQYSKGNKPVLIIDEAQNLSPETLEEIRMLSNLETSDSKLLQIILVGQPELRSVLADPQLRQLRQRISIQCHLQSLNQQEIEEYIFHRMRVAGNRDALSFSPESFEIIAAYTYGIPRLINILCDFILLAAFAERLKRVDGEMIQEIISDLDFKNHYWATSTPPADHIDGSYSAVSPFGNSAVLEIQAAKKFEELTERLDKIESEAISTTAVTLKDVDERLENIKQTFFQHLKSTNSMLVKLHNKINELPSYQRDVPQLSDAPKPHNTSLLRRFFGQ